MKDVSKELKRIETLLKEAEDALNADDGRPLPPSVPPKNRRDWAKDNSSAVDPDDYDSCKEYILRNLHLRPLLRPGMFPEKLADLFTSTVWATPGRWLQIQRNFGHRPAYLFRYEDARTAAQAECHELYGMEVQARYDENDGGKSVFWSGKFTHQFDSRQMTHAQRVAELRLLECRTPILHVTTILKNRAYDLYLVQRLLRMADLNAQFESAVAYWYMREVVEPLSLLGVCVLRSNLLSRVLYKSSKRRFPITGYGLGLDTRIAVPYPWWYRRIHWGVLLDAVIHSPSEDSENHEERKRWRGFWVSWATTKPETLYNILYATLYHCVRTRRQKAARTSLEMIEERLGGTSSVGQH